MTTRASGVPDSTPPSDLIARWYLDVVGSALPPDDVAEVKLAIRSWLKDRSRLADVEMNAISPVVRCGHDDDRR